MLSFLASICLATSASTAQLTASENSLQITTLLAIPPVGESGRVPFPIDPIQLQMVRGTWREPKAGDTMQGADGKAKTWTVVNADKDGNFSGSAFEGGYAYTSIDSESDRVMLLHATGDSMVYVNGEPRAGDVYGYGYVLVPINLHKGHNTLLFATGRGQMKVDLQTPKAALVLNPSDATLPDVVGGNPQHSYLGAVVLVNATDRPISHYFLETQLEPNGLPAIEKGIASSRPIPPLTECKVPIGIFPGSELGPGEYTLHVTVATGTFRDTTSLKFRVRKATQTYKRTYMSKVDDSVQYYAVVPPPNPKPGLAMILSLHGASVEATSQADAYSPHDWAWIACATNRRPFGFDWEDWGRRDGLDVLQDARKYFRTDPARTYVTGHSMGGHGTWQFGALFPGHFAAIGVSAGWESFFSYVGVPRSQHPTAMEDIFQRANGTSATLDMKNNFKAEGVYILHGDADDNVPVTEARHMHEVLSTFHHDLGYHEQKGAGHWWDGPAAPGADCLEWPEMMDFLRKHKLSQPESVDFTTANPAVSDGYGGVTVLEQIHPLAQSRITVRREGHSTIVTTQNIIRFMLASRWTTGPVMVDGRRANSSNNGVFAQNNGVWHPGSRTDNPQIGPFKRAFDNHVVLVYGTHGTKEQNDWAYQKACFDSESFWYRGNATLPMISDDMYLAGTRSRASRNVVLYGNADTNRAWKPLLRGSPIDVTTHAIRYGSNTSRGDDLACIFCWRKRNSSVLVGAVSGTGIIGMRLTNRMPYFTSGVGFPDWMISTPETLVRGMDGVLAAGYFDRYGRIGDRAENAALNAR